jgi:hypothetical protein
MWQRPYGSMEKKLIYFPMLNPAYEQMAINMSGKPYIFMTVGSIGNKMPAIRIDPKINCRFS